MLGDVDVISSPFAPAAPFSTRAIHARTTVLLTVPYLEGFFPPVVQRCCTSSMGTTSRHSFRGQYPLRPLHHMRKSLDHDHRCVQLQHFHP